MNLYFLFVQFLGFLAGIFLIFSYFRKNTNKVLSFHIISNSLDFVHYILLGAYSGGFVYLIEGVRDFLYYKTDKDRYIFIISAVLYISISFFQVRNIYDYLPIMASLIDGYSLTKNKLGVTVGAVISYSIWVIYNIKVLSYAGIIMDGIIAISNLVLLILHFNSIKERKALRHKIHFG